MIFSVGYSFFHISMPFYYGIEEFIIMSENKQTNSYLTSNCRNIYHIDKFKIPNDEITEMFPRAYALPTFFTHNLLSNNRIVKVFTGPDALLRVFYFQLMKLALEVEV